MKVRYAVLFVALSVGSVGSIVDAQGYTTVASFNNNGNGSVSPNGNLVMDASGNIFGTTFNGGTNNHGSIFEFSATTHALTTVTSFSSALNGANPNGGLTSDGQGNYLGVTAAGGAFGFGSIYQFTPGTAQLSTLVSFPSSQQTPNGGVTLDSAGNLYVTSLTGGTAGVGALVQVPHISGTSYGVPQTLVSFTGPNGDDPNGGVITDGKGNFYGTTYGGGGPLNAPAEGTVYKFSNSPSAAFSTIALFGTGYTPGHNPGNPLIIDGAGNLYGTTISTVFKIDAATGNVLTLANIFDLGDSSGILTRDASGNLFGTTNTYAFEIPAGSENLNILAQFTLAPFRTAWAIGGVLPDGNGNLYGATLFGGATGEGSIYEASVPEPSTMMYLTGAFLVLLVCPRVYRIHEQREAAARAAA